MKVAEQLRAVSKVTGSVLGRVVVKSHPLSLVLEFPAVYAHRKDLLYLPLGFTINLDWRRGVSGLS